MPYVAYYEFPGEPIENYDDGIARGGDAVRVQQARKLHVSFETEDGWAVIDLWESREALEAFVEAMEFHDRGRPRIYEVHNLIE